MHRAWYQSASIAADYVAVDVNDLSEFLPSAEAFDGFSVTMPLKEQAYSVANGHDEWAGRTGVVNTLSRSSHGWVGHNTDVTGFIDLLDAHGLHRVDTATVIGAGATARSAVLALADRADEIVVMARSAERAEAVVSLSSTCRFVPWREDSDSLQHQVVIATTPAGATDGLGSGQGLLIDVLYAPWPTALAEGWPGPVIDGLELLARQAARQVEIFFPGSDRVRAYEIMIGAARSG